MQSGARQGVLAWLLPGWKKEASHDGLDSLTFDLHALRAPAQFIATKSGEEAQTGPAEYLATSAFMSCRRDNTLLKHSAYSLA